MAANAPELGPWTDGFFDFHQMSECLNGTGLTFYFIKMVDSVFVWIGDTGDFSSLAVAMKTAYNPYPTSCSLIGKSSNDISCSIASKVCQKTGKQAFVSYNVSKNDPQMIQFVIRNIVEAITKENL